MSSLALALVGAGGGHTTYIILCISNLIIFFSCVLLCISLFLLLLFLHLWSIPPQFPSYRTTTRLHAPPHRPCLGQVALVAHSLAPVFCLEAVLVLVCSALPQISVGTEATRAPVARMRREGTLELLCFGYFGYIFGTGIIWATVIIPPLAVVNLS